MRISNEIKRIIEARHHDPFSVLGRHDNSKHTLIRCFLPHAKQASIVELDAVMKRIEGTGIFEWTGNAATLPTHYRLRWTDDNGVINEDYDPYTFEPQLGDLDLYLFGEGRHWHAYRCLGANPHTADGVEGTLFAVWAPNAERISVVGDFNRWDGRHHPMRVRGGSGVWELFIPGLGAGEMYKFEIRNRHTGEILLKTDPYGKQFQLRPDTSSITTANSHYPWQDGDWLQRRHNRPWQKSAMSVYEVHLGSWRREADGSFMNYRDIAHQLVAHVSTLGFTHIELLPITEHPFDGSWGYQTTGYYAPTSRFGSPDDFRYFVDYCHRHDIGVILDWVPAHFPKDAFALARFDGTALYEHEDPRKGEHRDWGTLIYNFGRNEVRNFLLSSALFWLEEYHLDGLRVDAVASMLYLDYSREHGDWIPNKYGGRENLEAIDFLRELNSVTHGQYEGTVIIAEESTAWPQVTRPTYLGGLGFSMKWNMGWMHDTLLYISKDPVHRHFHHNNLTFGMLYAFTENFMLPFSHDEVVHGKGSMLGKMPGDEWQRFANLRLLYTYMLTYPGKKLLFMGCEFGQGIEWDDAGELEWHLLDYEYHRGVQQLVGDLNHLYCNHSGLHSNEFEPGGFDWIDCNDSAQSVINYLRQDAEETFIITLNFTPVIRKNYRVGVPAAGRYRIMINSDSTYYGGSNAGDGGEIVAEAMPWMGRPYSIAITLPPLAGIVLKHEG